MDALSNGQRADIDALILAGSILGAIRRIMVECGVGLAEAKNINRARYLQLRVERGTEFKRGDEEYWSGYEECILTAMAKNL